MSSSSAPRLRSSRPPPGLCGVSEQFCQCFRKRHAHSLGTNIQVVLLTQQVRQAAASRRHSVRFTSELVGLCELLPLCTSFLVCCTAGLHGGQRSGGSHAVFMGQLKAPAGAEGYRTTYDDCSVRYPDVMAKWDTFFQALKAESTLPGNEKKDSILGVYWTAHMASLHASAACNAKQSHYSSEEVSFASSWLNSAEYVSAAHFHSSLEKSVPVISPLPGQILKEYDVAPNITDLTQEENHSLSTFSWMRRINTFLGGRLVNMWKGAMCSVSTREKGRDLMEQLMLHPSFATTTFLSIIREMRTSC